MTALRAYCLTCPHEICQVGYVRDARGGSPPSPGRLVCPCHFSTFDPLAGGEVVSGPAPRALYRFSVADAGDRVHITGVEAAILSRLG